MNEVSRGPWYLVFGLAVGLAAGLVYAWVISPVRYTDNHPSSLAAEFKDQYRAMIAQAYIADGDLGRAKARLELLEDPNPAQMLASQAQRVLAEEGNRGAAGEKVRAMALLASQLNTIGTGPATVTVVAANPGSTPTGPSTPRVITSTPSVLPPTTQPPTIQPTFTLTPVPPSATPSPTATPTLMATATPLDFPTFTPTITPMAPFILGSVEPVCQAGSSEGLLQIEVTGAQGDPVAGVLLTVSWGNGENWLITGLKPAVSQGYADFQMEEGVIYTLKAGDGGEIVRDLQAEPCVDEDGASHTGGLKVVFTQ